jgi:2',3'-cyclic-nucleotide 2'-phosphodiesterase (5'-nucleotidase family)
MIKLIKRSALAATLALATLTSAIAADFDVTFLLVNDVYKMNDDKRGGVARVNAVARAERANGGNVVYIHAGDAISPSLLSGFDQGEHMIELLNVVPLDIFIPGNHEFDFGKDVFYERMKALKGNILAANLRNPDGSAIEGIEDTMMLSYGDDSEPMNSVKIGIVGLTADDSPVKSNPGDLQFTASTETGIAKAKELREAGADIIIAATHANRQVDREMFDSGAFDIILTGDDHDLMLFYDGRTAMVESSEDGNYMTAVDVSISVGESRGKRRVRWHPNFRIMDTANTEPDPGTMAKVAEYEALLSSELDVELGKTDSELDTRKASVRTGETAVGNLISDAMRMAVGADVAITNGGGIRGNTQYAPGTALTRRDILTELPFGNKTLLLEVDGATIRAALENGVSQVENSAGRFPHVSGMSFTYDGSKPAGERVIEVMVGTSALDDGAMYKLATNDYMAGGGDGYTVLRGGKVLLGDLDGKLMANDVMAFIRAAGTVNAKVEGRVKGM